MLYSSTSSDERILCPQCFESINIIQHKSLENNNIIKENKLNEFTKLSCKNCSLEFTFLFCEYCENKIFMKIHPNAEKYNGLNGYNIKCPYKFCHKIFYFTICPICHRVQKQKKHIKEGNVIKCLYKDCNSEYMQVHSPIKFCSDVINMGKPKFHSNFPIGVMIAHKKEIMYQKINCYYCSRPIVYASSKNNKNQYYECQKVECPYDDCRKIFNRIICPFCCEEIYVNDGWYEMGSMIKCNFCHKVFGKILCPLCNRVNVCDEKFKLGKINCGFKNCLKENNMINCIFCRKLNIFDSEINLNGQSIKCGYCKNSFNEILCPYCRQINAFPLADFCFGKLYKCQYLTCMKEFQFLICPKCLMYSFSNEQNEGKKFRCDKCKITFINFGCPFCKSNIIIQNEYFKIGQMIKCPSKNCGKIYSFISCSKCQKLIFSKENENISGKAIKCPHQGCKRYTVSIICPLCKVNTIFAEQKNSFNENDDITCQKCKKNYKFKQNNEIYFNEMIALNQIEGRTINFGIGKIDENYLSIQQLFFYHKKNKNSSESLSIISNSININNSYNNKYKQIFQECIICHNNLRESVFFPCGHRCTCYNCAVIVFTVNKKCPKCNQEASCIIKRVYE